MTFSSELLTESRIARFDALTAHDEAKATELLNQVKAIAFAAWKGTGRATNEEVAAFYEVPVTTVKDALSRYRDEFEADGVETVIGKALQELRRIRHLSPNAKHTTLWTPKGTLRLGLVLTQSELAKAIRNVAMNLLMAAASKSEEARLYNETVRLENEQADLDVKLLQAQYDIEDAKTKQAEALSRIEEDRLEIVQRMERLRNGGSRVSDLIERDLFRQVLLEKCPNCAGLVQIGIEDKQAWLRSVLCWSDDFIVPVTDPNESTPTPVGYLDLGLDVDAFLLPSYTQWCDAINLAPYYRVVSRLEFIDALEWSLQKRSIPYQKIVSAQGTAFLGFQLASVSA